MKPEEFVKKLYPFAKASEEKKGISAVFTLAQAALETGWGNSAPGNMYFGVKCKSTHPKRQLLRTTEISTRNDLKFPEIISITPFDDNGIQRYRYRIRDWFRKYDTPEESFTDHAQFFYDNPRYKDALEVKGDPREFARRIALAGYATDPDYADKLIDLIDKISLLVLPPEGPIIVETKVDPVKEVSRCWFTDWVFRLFKR